MFWARVAALAALTLIAGCAGTSGTGSALSAPDGPYRLDTGDGVRVMVYGDAEISDVYRVDDGGNLAMPLVGPVPVRGLTTRQAASKIAIMLSNGFMRNPDVAAEIAEYRPFFIQGQVASSGQYPYVYGMTIRAAVSTAGGFSETAARTYAFVYRRQGGEMVKTRVGLDFVLIPGDTIVIDERWF
jgi:polysaccharide biosynthesis/export protein